jgi:hypothetical protein
MTDYVQIGTSAAYALPADSGYGWCGYVLPEGAAATPATLSPQAAYDADGHYLFAPRQPSALEADPTAFVAAFYDFLRQARGGTFYGRALLWMPGATLPAASDFDTWGLRIYQGFDPWPVVQNNLTVPLGDRLGFFITNGCVFSYDAAANALRLTSTVTAASVGFVPQVGDDCGLAVTGPTPSAAIPLTGDRAGGLTFTATLTTAMALDYFQVGLAYTVHSGGADVPLFYPLFDAAAMPAGLTLSGTLDPLDTLNTAMPAADLARGLVRSGFAVTGSTPALPSQFRSAAGLAIGLVPLGGAGADGTPAPFAGGLVFAGIGTSFGLTPVGDFGLGVTSIAAGTAGQRLLCGMFGTEWLGFTSYDALQPANDRLRFLAAQPAYAPVFPFADARMVTPDSGAVGARLKVDSGIRTSWATMIGGASTPGYSAQPAGSPLYGGAGTQDGATLLSPTPPATPLPATAGFAFPLVPYAAAQSSGGIDLTQFESEILAATRKSTIAAAKLGPKAAARRLRLSAAAAIGAANRAAATSVANRVTTPQGLLVDLAADGIGYDKVLLARSQQAGGTTLDLALLHPTDAMLEALQTNQLFLVGVTPAPFSSDGASFANAIEIAGWRFVANVGNGVQPTSYRNVVIMKYCSGSLKQRIGNANRWTMPETFSQAASAGGGLASLAYTGLAQWLQDYIAAAEAKAAAAPDSLYANFIKLVNDEGWNGFLVLNADLPLDALPEQIAGLAAGIDYTRFLAHHFGATVSRVASADGVLDVQGISSLFGLIDYERPDYEANLAQGVAPDTPVVLATKDGYAFTVLQLQALFEQSRLVTFNSRIQLSLDSLFGSAIRSTTCDGQANAVNAMVLDGTAVSQNGTTTYVFEQSRTILFTLDGNILPAVTVSRVQFNTLGSPDNGVTTASRFLMWGKLGFALVTDSSGAAFDILSFGSDDGAAAARGLAYANLQIHMAFPAATPNATSFAFVPDNLSFDVDASDLRAGSLYRGFSLQIKQYINAPADKTPADYGFLPVLPSGVTLSRLSGPWYGISYKVVMGTPGALVSGAGFESDLLVAWSPSGKAADRSRALFVGLSLPGAAPGASVFSLQGILKVSTGPIKLLYQTVPDQPDPTAKFFNLQLTDIGIKVLGIAKLPPGSTIQFFLFGDPQSAGSLGWYAAYVQDQKSTGAPGGDA